LRDIENGFGSIVRADRHCAARNGPERHYTRSLQQITAIDFIHAVSSLNEL
jgi:hypothetical protein